MKKQQTISQYKDQGYILVEALFDGNELDRYSDRFEALVSGEALAPPEMKIMKDIMVVKGVVEPKSNLHGINKIINFEDDAILYEYSNNEKMLQIVRSLIGESIYSITTNIFNKPPGVDGRHPMHQDLRYFRIRPESGIVGTWTAMCKTTRENGCLAILPGSHKGELLEHDNPGWELVNYAFLGARNLDYSKRVHIEMNPGDTLFFHPLLIHGSGQNKTQGFRRAISTHYASEKCESPLRDWRVDKQARKIGAGHATPV